MWRRGNKRGPCRGVQRLGEQTRNWRRAESVRFRAWVQKSAVIAAGGGGARARVVFQVVQDTPGVLLVRAKSGRGAHFETHRNSSPNPPPTKGGHPRRSSISKRTGIQPPTPASEGVRPPKGPPFRRPLPLRSLRRSTAHPALSFSLLTVKYVSTPFLSHGGPRLTLARLLAAENQRESYRLYGLFCDVFAAVRIAAHFRDLSGAPAGGGAEFSDKFREKRFRTLPETGLFVPEIWPNASAHFREPRSLHRKSRPSRVRFGPRSTLQT